MILSHFVAFRFFRGAIAVETPTVVASFTGVEAVFSLGSITASAIGWTDISTGDTPAYSAVNTGDSNTWEGIDTSGETASWADVA